MAAWQRRRRWSRTDSARWLNDRSPAVLAWLRRKAGSWPDHNRQIGYWLKAYRTRIFDRAHARLLGASDAEREKLLPNEALR